jgi:hypothetical protein
VAVLESSYCRLHTFCVKFRTEDPAIVAFWACSAARNDEMHGRPPLNQQLRYVRESGPNLHAQTCVLKKDSSALAENTIRRFRKLAQ